MRSKLLVVSAVASTALWIGTAAAQVGDPEKGAKVFVKCKACHTVEEGKNRVGPSLHGVVGREAGSVEGFKYSKAMQEADVVWTIENLHKYLENPKEFIPGNKMVFAGLKKEEDRADVIAYLQKESGQQVGAAEPALQVAQAAGDQPQVATDGAGQARDAATAEFVDRDGKGIGSAQLRQTPAGVLLTMSVEQLPPGEHGFHIHAVGQCEPPFESAGGHFNPTNAQHGFLTGEEHHAGDLPNLHVGSDGKAAVEYIIPAVTLRQGQTALLDDDGASLVVHERADDYSSQPAGDSGARIACAELQPAGEVARRE